MLIKVAGMLQKVPQIVEAEMELLKLKGSPDGDSQWTYSYEHAIII